MNTKHKNQIKKFLYENHSYIGFTAKSYKKRIDIKIAIGNDGIIICNKQIHVTSSTPTSSEIDEFIISLIDHGFIINPENGELYRL